MKAENSVCQGRIVFFFTPECFVEVPTETPMKKAVSHMHMHLKSKKNSNTA